MAFEWVYVLVSDNGRFFTTGATRDLAHCFERMRPEPHVRFPRVLSALYRVETGRGREDARDLERRIALQLMKAQGGEWHRVLSSLGQFSRGDRVPPDLLRQPVPVLCHCGLPAERRLDRTGRWYYTCPRRNRDWLQRYPLPHFIRSCADRTCDFYAHSSFYEA
jgi:hypothetical protein